MADPAEPVEKKEEQKNALPECSQDAIAAFARTDDEYWKSPFRRILHFLVFILLGPIRFILVVATLAVYAGGLRVCAFFAGCSLEDVQLKSPAGRHWFLGGKEFSLNILRFFGLRVKRTGDPSITAPDGSEARFVVSNHVSMLDIFALYGGGLPSTIPSFVSKAGVFDVPIMGPLARACRGIAVYRSKTAGTGTTQLLKERAAKPEEPPVAIYPEGTTSNGSCLGFFHAGAFAAGAPVKPVCLRYTYSGFNPAYDVISATEWMYGILGSIGIKIEIVSLPVYVPNEEEKKDPLLYGRNVRAVIAKELGVPVYDVTFKDKLAYMVKYKNYKLKEHED